MDAKLSIRIDLPTGTRFGPGKAALLGALATHGSISAAARALGMSYPRALKLVAGMNGQFRQPLVETFHGGAERGGARLTPFGQTLLARYGALTDAAEAATACLRAEIAQSALEGGRN